MNARPVSILVTVLPLCYNADAVEGENFNEVDKREEKGFNSEMLFAGSVIVLVGIAFWAGMEIYGLNITIYEERVSSAGEIWELESQIDSLKKERRDLAEANENLRGNLEEEIRLSDSLMDRLEVATGEIEIARKLQEIDPELLRKYSRVYFLNENYEPVGLVEIPDEYLAPTREEAFFHEDAWPFLYRMLRAVSRIGIEPEIVSGFRSFDEQTELKERYNIIYGEGTANQFSASQGYSEHQLGTAVDFSVKGMQGALDGFEHTEFYAWLKENAHKYGFILSYPKGNTSYVFEPWHWRFVGVELATELNDRGINFYDMDQREIDEYRVRLFDR